MQTKSIMIIDIHQMLVCWLLLKKLFTFINIYLESRLSEYEFNEDEEQYDEEEEDDNEEVAINNLQTVRRNTWENKFDFHFSLK